MGQLPGGLRVSIGNTPQARDDYFAFTEESLVSPLALDVLANDGGGSARSLFAVFEGPPPADLSSLLNGYPAAQNSFVSSQTGATISIDADGTVHYDPSTAFFDYASLADGEQLVETITYVIQLANGAFSVATTTVSIDGAGTANEAPETTDDNAATDEDTAVNGTVVDNTTDADNDPATELTYSVVGLIPAGLIFNPDGTYVFDPAGLFEYLNEGESAEVSFQYKANDGQADSNVSNVTITIDGVDDVVGTPDIDAFLGVRFNNKVLINQGGDQAGDSGEFVPGADQPEGGPRTFNVVALGDLDGDGDLDAYVTNSFSLNQVLFNQGGAQGGTPGDFNLAPNQPEGPNEESFGVALGDFDGDGDLDAFVVNRFAVNQVLVNQGGSQGGTPGDLNLGPVQPEGGALDTMTVAVGDLDGDGDLDAFVGNRAAPNQVLINQGGTQGGVAGDFRLGTHQPEGGAFDVRDVALGDVDGDGDLDAFVTYLDQANELLINQGGAQGGIVGDFDLAPDQPEGGIRTSFAVALGDVDGDGDLDAFIANFLNEENQLLINQGGIQGGTAGDLDLSATQPEGGLQSSSYVALGDLDGDGDLDAWISNSTGDQVLLNQGGAQGGTAGDFDLAPVQPQANSYSVALGDLDGDGTVPPIDANGLPNINLIGYLPELYETPPVI